MKVAVLDQKVRRNIELFKHLLLHQAKKSKKYVQTAKMTYKAFIHRVTGELQFFDLEKQELPKEAWKGILIQLRPVEGEGAFEVVDLEDKNSFNCAQLDHKAYVILTKTLHILNQLSYDPKQGRNPLWVLRQVSLLEFEMTEEEEGRKNLIQDAWYEINRLQAEILLKRWPAGTYLFRKGEFAEALEENLNLVFPIPITCLTLTYCSGRNGICERIIVYKNGGWMFYNDDLTLSAPTYPTIEALLKTMGEKLAQPLSNRPN